MKNSLTKYLSIILNSSLKDYMTMNWKLNLKSIYLVIKFEARWIGDAQALSLQNCFKLN